MEYPTEEDQDAHDTNSDQESIQNRKKRKKRGVKEKEVEAVQKSTVEKVLEQVSTEEEDEEVVRTQPSTS